VSRTVSPVDRLLGATGESPQCRVFSEDVAVHWFPRGAHSGDACLCGETTMREDEDSAASAPKTLRERRQGVSLSQERLARKAREAGPAHVTQFAISLAERGIRPLTAAQRAQVEITLYRAGADAPADEDARA
jgi:hypothetical protein